VISTDTKYTGAGNETPPADVMCWSDQVVLTAPIAAPVDGTGLPVLGSAAPVRLRGLTATGAFAAVRPPVQTTALEEFAVAGVLVEHISSTPGDLPPDDRLS
jgi:hypothetical protein